MYKLSRYVVSVKHDKGKTKIKVAARSKKAAAEIIKRAEKCPDRAILSIKKGEEFKWTKIQEPRS